MKLKELASLRTGLVLNRKKAIKPDENVATYKQLMLKSIMPDGIIDTTSLEEFQSKELLKPEYFTQKNDVVVRLSYPYTAVSIDEKTEKLLVPSHFVIIRCNTKKIFPGYLEWLINSDKLNKYISKSTSTSALGTIKPSFFSELEIYPISIKDQQALSDLHRLSKKEIYLLEQLKIEKQKYYSALTNKIQKEMRSK